MLPSSIVQDKVSAVLNRSPETVFIQLPVTYQVLNQHLWICFVAETLFGQQDLRPTFITGMCPKWKNYNLFLEFFYSYLKSNGSLKGILGPVIKDLDDVELDNVLNYGIELKCHYRDIIHKMQQEVDFFLDELNVTSLPTAYLHMFHEWYDLMFEKTSDIHRNAYYFYAQGKIEISEMHALLLAQPVTIETLAIKKEKVQHNCVWEYDQLSNELVCTCGSRRSIYAY